MLKKLLSIALVFILAGNLMLCNELPKPNEPKKTLTSQQKKYTKAVVLGVIALMLGCLSLTFLFDDVMHKANTHKNTEDDQPSHDTTIQETETENPDSLPLTR
ncbi:hypothetical protein Noda2021_11280 [Candidatus Dependentiae bacterium Noda2021]|nr:hypothetical protein Noda2021_11280 [Candidatus Dependentiae bacterium Noda2021]